MEVESCVYRNAARIVAIIYAILLGLVMFSYVFMLVMGISVIASIDPTLTQDSKDVAVIRRTVIYTWILLGTMLIVGISNFWAITNLYKATRMGTNILEALPRALIWRNLVVVFVIIEVVADIASKSWGSLAFSLLIHGIMIYFVQKFISEMQQTLESGKSHLPTPIAPVKQ